MYIRGSIHITVMCVIKHSVTEENLKVHQRLHTGKCPYICGVCNKAYKQLEYMKVHQRAHTGVHRCGGDMFNKNIHLQKESLSTLKGYILVCFHMAVMGAVRHSVTNI